MKTSETTIDGGVATETTLNGDTTLEVHNEINDAHLPVTSATHVATEQDIEDSNSTNKHQETQEDEDANDYEMIENASDELNKDLDNNNQNMTDIFNSPKSSGIFTALPPIVTDLNILKDSSPRSMTITKQDSKTEYEQSEQYSRGILDSAQSSSGGNILRENSSGLVDKTNHDRIKENQTQELNSKETLASNGRNKNIKVVKLKSELTQKSPPVNQFMIANNLPNAISERELTMSDITFKSTSENGKQTH